MKRMLGFILFWIAFGMFLMFFLRRTIIIFGLIIIFLAIGYLLFCD